MIAQDHIEPEVVEAQDQLNQVQSLILEANDFALRPYGYCSRHPSVHRLTGACVNFTVWTRSAQEGPDA